MNLVLQYSTYPRDIVFLLKGNIYAINSLIPILLFFQNFLVSQNIL